MKPLTTLASQLRNNTTACRVSFEWFGVRKALDQTHKAQAAKTFNAHKDYLSASQKLLDTKHPAYTALTSLKNDIVCYWKSSTLPYTEDGVRLIPKDRVNDFNNHMSEFKERFSDAADKLNDALAEIKAEAQKRLGELFNAHHYPESIKDYFNVQWDFPSIEPPEYLAQLAPSVYAQEKERIQNRLQEAVALAEAAFLNEFQSLIASLHERLSPGDDNKKKIFRDSTVTNLNEFFSKFKSLNIGSNEDLDKVIEEAQALVKGIEPDELRKSDVLRAEIAKDLRALTAKLEPMIVNAPRRKITRPNGATNGQQLLQAANAIAV